jgi:hypothetical protein
VYIDFVMSCSQLAMLQIETNAPDLRKLGETQYDALMDAGSIIKTYKLR